MHNIFSVSFHKICVVTSESARYNNYTLDLFIKMTNNQATLYKIIFQFCENSSHQIIKSLMPKILIFFSHVLYIHLYISAFCSKLYTAQYELEETVDFFEGPKLLYCTCRLNITCTKSEEAQVIKLGKPHLENIQFLPIQPLVELVLGQFV